VNDLNLKLYAHARAPYDLNNYGDKAYVYNNNEHIASFENVEVRDNFILINHFSVTGDCIGKSLGKPCLELFAQSVSSQKPEIEMIKFSLHRISGSRTYDKLEKITDAREELLEVIGAVNITRQKTNSDTIVVEGEWPKSAWPK
jgi:hypothetical protein